MKNRKSLFLKSLLVGSALISNSMAIPNPMATGFKSGMYVGPQIGAAFQHTNFETDLTPAIGTEPLEKTKDKHSAHFLFGGTAGYRFVHKSNFVLGVSLDADFGHKKVKRTLNYSEIGANTINLVQKRKYNMTPAIMMGHVICPKWMIFTQLGVMISKYELTTIYPNGPTKHKKNKTIPGFTAGLGTEYAMNKMWSLKGSINYEISKTLRASFKNILSATGASFETVRVENKAVALKLSAIYKF